ncbi:MAG: 3-hydroxyacyl-CoA dehydrogenase family protein [Candidatus Hermodarchaeota archaeon]
MVQKIAVIGCGAMGSGIAYICAWKGYEVTVNDLSEEFLEKGFDKIRQAIVTGIEKGKLTIPDAEAVMNRLEAVPDLKITVQNADLVIEAVSEDMNVKKELFAKLDEYTPPSVILASNTSTLSISEIASVTKRPEKVIGMHFFNPVVAMRLIEIVVGEKTSEETIQIIKDVTQKIEKTWVIAKDTPGFIVNRIIGAIINEGIRLLDEGLASKEDIDKAVMLGLNLHTGPIAMADYIGLDIVYHAGNTLYEKLGDRYKPSDTLKKLVEKKKLGIKTGEGFYKY